eukprot:scaffold25215_cov52-Attheya_sp.AAC.1
MSCMVNYVCAFLFGCAFPPPSAWRTFNMEYSITSPAPATSGWHFGVLSMVLSEHPMALQFSPVGGWRSIGASH